MSQNFSFDDEEQDLDRLFDDDSGPAFPLEEEDLPPVGEPEGGISRTFKIIGGIILLGVVLIVILLIVLALGGGDDLTANQQTSTAVAILNATTEQEYYNTVTAFAIAVTASQEAIQTFEAQSTQTQAAVFAQQTQTALDAASSATAAAAATQTAEAQASATAEALSLTQTAEAIINTLKGQLVGANNTPFTGATLLLYRDDGDGQFNPAETTPPPIQRPSGGSGQEASGAPAGTLSYDQTVEGTLPADGSASWTFSGAAGDVVTINAVALDVINVDTFLVLVGPDGATLAEDDDSGDQTNAAIFDFVLPASGVYEIRVSSVADPGEYSLSLTAVSSSAPTAPESAPVEEALPTQEGSTSLVPHALARLVVPPLAQGLAQGDEPTATPEVPPAEGDSFVAGTVTQSGGEFDFGPLEPGVYWLKLDYDSLPPNLKAQVSPTEEVVIMVEVPVEGEVKFTVGQAPTPTPSATLEAEGTEPVTEFVTLTPTPEMPESGLLSDIGSGGNLEGSSGLVVLAIAGIGLVAVVFVARKLRTTH